MLEQSPSLSASASTERILPLALRIVTPPKHDNRELSAAYVAERQHILLQSSLHLVSNGQTTSCMAASGGKSWQLPSPLWRRKRGGSQDEGGEGSEGNHEPPSPPPSTSASSPRSWQVRRRASASSYGSPVPPAETSPTSPSSKMNRRPSRLSSFIRRHHSAGVAASQEPIPPHLGPPQPTYIPYSQSSQPPRSAPPQNTSFPQYISTSLPPSSVPYRPPMSNTVPAFSPVGRNPYEPWNIPQRPHTAFPTTIGQPMERPFPTPNPTRGFSNSSAPETSSTPLPRILDTSAKLDAEPEGFTSPSEFALFAEATSSLSILSPAPDQARLSRSIPAPPQRQTLPLPAASTALLAPSPMLAATRAQSVPPSVPTPHLRSNSNSYSHSQSHIPPLPRGHAPIRPRPSRTQLIAEALTGVDDDNSGHGSDDELPDYATSQAEASAQQRLEAARRARELEDSWRRGRVERSRYA